VSRRPHRCGRVRKRHGGATLIVTLILLIAVLMLGLSAAQIALLAEKASRNDRDRQIAFQAAEAALIDAELDIEHSPDSTRSRSHLFSGNSARGFPEAGTCGTAAAGMSFGLCAPAAAGAGKAPVWLGVDFDDVGAATARSVPFGRFTGRVFQTGKGALPSRPPRYVIELMSYSQHGESAERPGYFYRITAIGYGARDITQVVLQSFYRKEG